MAHDDPEQREPEVRVHGLEPGRAVVGDAESALAAIEELSERATTAAAKAEPHPALETLRAVDVDRLTPLDALQLVASLKRLVITP